MIMAGLHELSRTEHVNAQTSQMISHLPVLESNDTDMTQYNVTWNRVYLTRIFISSKSRLQIICLVKMANITPCFYLPFISIRQVKYIHGCIQYLSSTSMPVRMSSFPQRSNRTTMRDHNYSLPCALNGQILVKKLSLKLSTFQLQRELELESTCLSSLFLYLIIFS